MRKVDAQSVDEIRVTVIAALHRQADEMGRHKERLYKLAELPYGPQEEIQLRTILASMVDPYVDNLAGFATDEEFLEAMKDLLQTNIESQVRREIPPEEVSEASESISRSVEAVVNSLITHLLPPNYQEKFDQYWHYVFELAKERDIAPQSVFTSDELYKEVVRHVYTREEYQADMERAINIFNDGIVDKIIEVVIKPIAKAFLEGEEDGGEKELAEFINEVREEMYSNSLFQDKMKAMKDALSQLIAEEAERIYG